MPCCDDEEHSPSEFYCHGETNDPNVTFQGENVMKCRLSSTYRYGLQFEVKNNNLHLLLYILLSGDVAINPGPCKDQHLRCLSFNAQSIRSTIKSPDGTLTSN